MALDVAKPRRDYPDLSRHHGSQGSNHVVPNVGRRVGAGEEMEAGGAGRAGHEGRSGMKKMERG